MLHPSLKKKKRSVKERKYENKLLHRMKIMRASKPAHCSLRVTSNTDRKQVMEILLIKRLLQAFSAYKQTS